MLVERFNGRVFDQIAIASASAPDGICRELTALEAKAKKSAQPVSEPPAKDESEPSQPPQKKTATKSDTSTTESEQSAMLAEWAASQITMEWARLEPSLATTDLRPYLFVAKDRKDYFGAATVFGQVAAIVERLLGAKLAVQGEEPSLRVLAPPEARIMASGSFEKMPEGVDGLAVLVRAQPTLQPNLLDFLEALPASQLGPWVCSGWTSTLKDAGSTKRFDELLQVWSTTGTSFLKTAAASSLRMRSTGGR